MLETFQRRETNSIQILTNDTYEEEIIMIQVRKRINSVYFLQLTEIFDLHQLFYLCKINKQI